MSLFYCIGDNAQGCFRVVEEVVDSKLKPLSRNIARLREDTVPDFTDIVGGIGYIIGLMGVALYFKSKEKK